MSTLWIRLAALAGVVGISFSGILARAADAPPATITFFRALYAAPVLAVIWLLIRSRDHRTPRSRAMAFGAGLLLALDLTLWHHAIDLIGAGLATVLGNSQVIFVGLAAWLVWRESPSRTAVAVIPVVLIGITLLSGLGRADAYGVDPVGGAIFGVLTGIAYAGFLLVFRAANRTTLAPTPGPLLDATVGTVVGGLVAGLVTGGLELSPTWPSHGWLLLLALLAQVFGWLLIAHALPRLAALETSVILLAQPVGALIWARLIFAETLSWIQALGVAVVLLGVLTLSLRGSVRTHPRQAPIISRS